MNVHEVARMTPSQREAEQRRINYEQDVLDAFDQVEGSKSEYLKVYQQDGPEAVYRNLRKYRTVITGQEALCVIQFVLGDDIMKMMKHE